MISNFKMLIFAILVFANFNGIAQKKSKTVLRDNWCRRYVGKIGGQPVVVNLYTCIKSNSLDTVYYSGGNYYYVNKSELLNLELTADEHSEDIVHATESLLTDGWGDGGPGQDDSWDLTIKDGHANGKFHKANTAQTYEIELTEDYTEACRLAISEHNDSVLVKGRRWNGRAAVSCLGITAGEGTNERESDFINRSIMKLFSYDGAKLATFSKLTYPKIYYKEYLAKYLSVYKTDVKKLQSNMPEQQPLGDFEQNVSIVPFYNARGLLVVGNSWYDYAGGAHGNRGEVFVNIDVKEHHVLKLTNIMEVNKTVLSNALNAAARKKFHIAKGQTLEEVFFVKTVPVTNNFIISDKGLTFCYSTYEIAAYAAGNIKLFVPYSSIIKLLKPEFIKRMGIQ